MYRDAVMERDEEGLARVHDRVAQVGEQAYIAATIAESPLMYWVEHMAGVENAHLFLADYRDEVEELFDVMHANICRMTEIMVEDCPVDALYMCENTSTTLISPDQYRRYCMHHIGDYSRITSQAGCTMILHMCGHLKALLPDIATLPVQGFEAFTSPTLGNTTLLDGRTDCPEVCLIGGTNAMLWTRPASAITAQIAHDLDELPHHRGLVVTSAGVFPPLCTPETAREVCEWVQAYPARWEAEVAQAG
jgi:uroporphyrinogen-III decarboxylase